ncbi:MAG: hypothetical protein IT317_14085, partial [Anaerolineales bacterium]|nr:hypothetical protein [Anaerolineales bacterium]
RGFAAHLVSRVAAVQAHFALTAGNLPAAVAWAEASGLTADDELRFPRETEYLVLARVWLAQAGQVAKAGLLGQARQLLDRLMADAASKERGASVLEILLVQAQAFDAQGDRPAALAALGQALALAAPEGYIRRFVDEGPALWALLQAVDPNAIVGAPSYVAMLLAAIAAEPGGHPRSAPAQPAVRANAGLDEPLTARELEVLRLIAAGQSNAQIAQALVIAVSTVKTHTNTIFGKLGVTSRTQAIARAHELRLL